MIAPLDGMPRSPSLLGFASASPRGRTTVAARLWLVLGFMTGTGGGRWPRCRADAVPDGLDICCSAAIRPLMGG